MNLWSRLGQDQIQVELRQRAAEGAGWLSSLRLLDKLMHDPEKCVRDVARKSLDARRKRDLADSYLNKIIHAAKATIIPKDQKDFDEQSSAFVASQLSPASLESATFNNGIVLRALPYGEALTHLGEDQHIEALRDFSRSQRLPGHVFYWLETIFTETQEQWDKITKGWPKPWRDLREDEEALRLFYNF